MGRFDCVFINAIPLVSGSFFVQLGLVQRRARSIHQVFVQDSVVWGLLSGSFCVCGLLS